MKKLLKNKKGFTLVELLAVIVVLAIIMVIATTQITGVIKKNTVDSFRSSLDVVAKQAKTAYLQYGESVTADNIADGVDYDKSQYTITLETKTVDGKDETQVCITSVAKGKFDNMDDKYFSTGTGDSKKLDTGWSKKDTVTTACKNFK